MLRAVTFWIQGTFPKYRYRKFVFETYPCSFRRVCCMWYRVYINPVGTYLGNVTVVTFQKY
jgi:hypothetical protein